MLEDQARQRVVVGQFLEHVLGGRGLALRRLAQHRQALALEQNLLNLLRRGDVERRPGLAVGLLLDVIDLLRQLAGLRAQHVGIDQHAGALDAREHRQQRPLDGLVDIAQGGVVLQPGPQPLVQLQCHVGVLGGVGPGLLQRHLVEGELGLALAGHVGELDGAVAEMILGQRVHVVAACRVEHVGLKHGVVGDAAYRDAMARQHAHVVLEVLADLRALRILQQRFQRGEHRLDAELLRRAGVGVGAGHVGRLARRHRE